MECFTDASYSPQTRTAIIGWSIPQLDVFQLEVLRCDGVAFAEKMATVKAMEKCRSSGHLGNIKVYTDHQGSEKSLETWNQQYGPIELIYVKGHKKNIDKTPQEIEFTKVDRATRKKLRELIGGK